MTNEVLLNKKVSIERCIVQIKNYYAQRGDKPFDTNFLLQDAIAMNLQRISELAIDIANYVIKKKKLGLPQTSADSFVLLYSAGMISEDMMRRLKGMVAFRNIVVHEYKKLDLMIMADVIENHLHEPLAFADLALNSIE